MSRARPRTRLPRTVPVGQMRRNLRSVQRFRLNFVFGVLLALYVVLLGRLGNLQLVEAASWKSQAHDAQHGRTVFRGLRGRILDARGRTLVTSRRVLSVAVDPFLVRERATKGQVSVREFSRRLGTLLDAMDGGRGIEAAIRAAPDRCRHLPLGGPVEDERIVQVLLGFVGRYDRTVEAGLAGLKVQVRECRTYPNGDYASHVLGLAPDGSCGRSGTGIERECQADLLGSVVSVPVCRGYHRPMAIAALDPLEGRGRDIRLTLDIVVQHYAETSLDAAMAKWQATEGTALVLEPQTGHVLALVSRGAHGLDLATKATWPPGSLLKPLTVAKGLDGGYTTADEVFDLSSPALFSWRRGTRLVHDFHGMGSGTVVDIVAESSNVGAAKIFWRLLAGPDWREPGTEPSFDRATAFLRELGFYGPTGLELADELMDPRWADAAPNPLFPAVGWAFGKGIAVPPLKVLCAFAALARDDGRIVRPTLIPGQGGDGRTCRRSAGRWRTSGRCAARFAPWPRRARPGAPSPARPSTCARRRAPRCSGRRTGRSPASSRSPLRTVPGWPYS